MPNVFTILSFTLIESLCYFRFIRSNNDRFGRLSCGICFSNKFWLVKGYSARIPETYQHQLLKQSLIEPLQTQLYLKVLSKSDPIVQKRFPRLPSLSRHWFILYSMGHIMMDLSGQKTYNLRILVMQKGILKGNLTLYKNMILWRWQSWKWYLHVYN